MPKKKYYVVWHGLETGIYESWKECEAQIKGFPGALYAGFPSKEIAQEAYEAGYEVYRSGRPKKSKSSAAIVEIPKEVEGSWSVDAACSGNPGKMEYRGVETDNGNELFRMGPYTYGTNNIGEFLAIVHAAALLKKMGDFNTPIYSDSRTAMKWIRDKRANTKLKKNTQTEIIHTLIERAENWLRKHEITNEVRKWDTKTWGEIPADFGRK